MIVVLATTLFEKRGLTISQNFLLSDKEFTSKFVKCSFSGFFREIYTKVSLFFVFFSRCFCPIAQKLISKSRTFHNCLKSVFCNKSPLICSKILLFHRACLFKISMKILRKCWYSILFMSCFNISLSSSTLNSSLLNSNSPCNLLLLNLT